MQVSNNDNIEDKNDNYDFKLKYIFYCPVKDELYLLSSKTYIYTIGTDGVFYRNTFIGKL